ncbi:hypothetical protein ABZ897_56350 [Nonomuraea sp. NPDC046802]|uniref:hypothetical protein n=1 Tax=Nonomuraea sp. NPDC046802 TaxID=3154919 RepID=UPI0033D21C2D
MAIDVLPGFRLEWPITDDLASLRAGVRAFGTGAGLTDKRLADLVIAASEAATRVLDHGGGGTVLGQLCDEISLDDSDGTTRLHLRFHHRARQNGDRRVPA